MRKRKLAPLVLGLVLMAPAAADAITVPTQRGSPWPSMRHDARNTGPMASRGAYRGGRPWTFRTGKGIFSTPVIGGDGTA